jgi:hypothetical protein
MFIGSRSKLALTGAAILTLAAASTTRADDDVAAELRALRAELKASQARISELESKQGDNWLTEERATQIRGIVQDVIKDAKLRSQFADGPQIGYKDGFFIQSADQNYKLVVGGFAQVRYEAGFFNATNGRSFSSRTVGNGSATPSDPGNSDGFGVRRARVNFSGNAVTPDLTYKLEGDFYGNGTGNFTVTDAFVAYRFTDLFRIKAGSYKVPFAKAELTSDTNGQFNERSEVLFPFDPVRSIGVSLYGDFIKDTLGYEVAVNNGSRSNTLRYPETVGLTGNLDNRLGFYGRVQWAGSGKISDFADEPDLRKDNRDFIWMLGGAAGYESQNATNNAFPSPQTTASTPGLSNGDGPGFASPYNLNGDIFRGTIDWSAKYQGFSATTGAYIQQVNANPGNTSSTSATNVSTGPYGATDSSFFQWGTYGQVGYFIIPQKLELTGRAGILATEGYPNIGEFYTLGANYYIYGHNLKVTSDVTYSPEAAYTDAASGLLQNTHEVLFRVQLQLKF